MKRVMISLLLLMILGVPVFFGHGQALKEVAKDQFPPPTAMVK